MTSTGSPPKRAFQTDVSRPARLPTARLQNAPAALRHLGRSLNLGPSESYELDSSEAAAQSAETLDQLSDKTNKAIDEEVETLLDAFRSILELSTVRVRSHGHDRNGTAAEVACTL